MQEEEDQVVVVVVHIRQITDSFISIMPKFTHKKKSINPKKPCKSAWEHYLEKIYCDPSHPGSFQGANKFHEAIKDEGKYTIPLSKVK